MWHLRGVPAVPSRVLSQIDVVLNALHCGVGEDGTVQHRTRALRGAVRGFPRAFSGAPLNKVRARTFPPGGDTDAARYHAFNLANQMNTSEMAEAVFSQFSPPYVEARERRRFLRNSVRPDYHRTSERIGDVLDAYGAALVEEYLWARRAHRRHREFSAGKNCTRCRRYIPTDPQAPDSSNPRITRRGVYATRCRAILPMRKTSYRRYGTRRTRGAQSCAFLAGKSYSHEARPVPLRGRLHAPPLSRLRLPARARSGRLICMRSSRTCYTSCERSLISPDNGPLAQWRAPHLQ